MFLFMPKYILTHVLYLTKNSMFYINFKCYLLRNNRMQRTFVILKFECTTIRFQKRLVATEGSFNVDRS